MAEIRERKGRHVCSSCGDPVAADASFCPTCHSSFDGTPIPSDHPSAKAPARPSVILRNRCSVCSECGADVAPKAGFCPKCRASFDGKPVSPMPPASYQCLGCGADLPAGSAFCPKCGVTITRFYAPGEPLSQEDTQRQYIRSLVHKQQVGWTWVIVGLVLTFFGWFVYR